MKTKLIVGLAVFAAFGIAGFLYLTRPLAEPTPTSDAAERFPPEPETEENGSAALFRISSAESLAEFNVKEVLRGSNFLVVGTSSQVSGDVAFDPGNPSESRVGTIRINARTLKTDDSRRDSAIGRFILRSEEEANEFIEFKPGTLDGLPPRISTGDAFAFETRGDLTIAGITREASFRGAAVLESEGTLTGSAQAVIRRADFGLTIPSVPFVAAVDEEVILKIQFTAIRVEGVE
ncbi:YceI family protein [Candidatus Parcubacteria bacterium]|nr:MAG: YceI family protein [Candidatus Parcubacteria bacterium]